MLYRTVGFSVFLVVLSGLCSLSSVAQTSSSSANDPAQVLLWRNVGPARIGGHVTDIAVPRGRAFSTSTDGAVFYVAGPGGLFKTADEGESWTPLFDTQPVSAVNAVSVSPSDSNVVWVGTGFPDSYRSIVGNGVFRSVDGGATWRHIGLSETEYIGSIAIHPQDARVAYVAAIGSLSRPSENRGIYKTTDGGIHWTRVLFVNEYTGAVDLVMDPTDPNRLYAAFAQRGLATTEFIDHGPSGGLFGTADGGKTWRQLTGGLPSVPLGRCGLSVSASSPNIIYSLIAAAASDAAHPTNSQWVAVYRSDNYGVTWRLMGTPPTAAFRDDLGRIWVDPLNEDCVYVGGQGLDFSSNGGRSFVLVADPFRDATADQHALWIDPNDPGHLILGNDRGIFISRNHGSAWRHLETLTLAQYFSVGADRGRVFYRIYGNMRDNAGRAIPNRSRDHIGITNDEMTITDGNETGETVVDRVDGHSIYNLGSGGLTRSNSDTGINVWLGPYPIFGESSDLLRAGGLGNTAVLSPHDHRVVYTATLRVWKSPDQGLHWKPISPVFPAPPLVSDTIMGMRRKVDRTGFAAAISTIGASGREQGVLYAGSLHSTVYVSRDEGKHWTTCHAIPSLPDESIVVRIVPSSATPGVAYVAARAILTGEVHPYLYQTEDYGEHWTSLSLTLPDNATISDIVEHSRTPSLLFLGTDRGVFYTIDTGRHWRPLRGVMPAIRAVALMIHPESNDLVVATWGRGVWVLDDITPLECLQAAEESSTVILFPVRTAMRYQEESRTRFYTPQFSTPNPPYGALINYYVPRTLTNVVGRLQILDHSGKIVRQFEIPLISGLHRVVWDLRYPPTETSLPNVSRSHLGPLVQTGRYRVRLISTPSSAGFPDQSNSISITEKTMIVLPDPFRSQTEQNRDSAYQLRAQHLLRKIQVVADIAEKIMRQIDAINAYRMTTESKQCALRESLTEEVRDILISLPGSGSWRDTISSWPLSLMVLGADDGYPQPPAPIADAFFTKLEKRLDFRKRRLNSIRQQLSALSNGGCQDSH